MDNMENKVSVKEYVLCNLILAVLGLTIIFVGVSGLSLFILIPAILTYMFARFNLKRMILPIIIIVALPSFVSLKINIVPAMLALPMSFMLGIAIKRKYSLLKTVSFGAIGEMVSLVLALMVFYMNSGDVMAYLSGIISQAITDVGSVYSITTESAQMLYEMFNLLLPSVFVSMIAFSSYFVFYIALLFLKKRDKSYVGVYRAFSEIKADRTCAVVSLICFAISMFTDGIVAQTLLNIIVIIMVFMFVCGVSSMAYIIRRIKNRVGKVIMYIILAVVALTSSSIFIFIGLIDAFANIRKIGKKSE